MTRVQNRRAFLTLVAVLSTPTALGAAPATRIESAVGTLAEWVSRRGGQLGVAIVNLSSGSPIALRDADTPLNPASNMKLLTAATALDTLGSQFRYRTSLHGVQQGSRVTTLVLRGDGDPSLRLAELWRVAHSLSSRGVREVGRILVDQSFFDERFVPPAFDQQPNEWATFRAPISAIALERNAVTLNIVPTTVGSPARVWFEPGGVVQAHGVVSTVAQGNGQAVAWTLAPSGSRLDSQLSGHVAAGIGRLRFSRRLEDPRLAAGFALRRLLTTEGVTVGADVALGGQDVEPRLTYQESQPLTVLLLELGKRSDNFTAEMLFKRLDPDAGKTPATSAGGAAAVRRYLATVDASSPGTRVVNGSGLFDANRISAATLVRVVSQASRDSRFGPEFISHLSIAGVDGTLARRLHATRARRSVRAKTGTLASAIALSGVILGPTAQPEIAFSILINGIAGQHAAQRAAIDTVVLELERTASNRPR